MNGISIAKILRVNGYNGNIIFLTAFREYVFQGYEVHALNYLLKPITLDSLKPCMDEVARDLSGNTYVFTVGKKLFRFLIQIFLSSLAIIIM